MICTGRSVERKEKTAAGIFNERLIENKFAVSVFDGMRIDSQVNGFMEKSL